MKYKLSSLCIIAGLLLGSSQVNAAYYYYRPVSTYYEVVPVSTCNTCNTCNSCQTRCAVKHTCYHPVKHHRHVKHYPRYYYASPQHSYYKISTYYVYSTPFGDNLWVPTCGSCCGGSCISAEEYDRAFYGPYYPVGSYPSDDSDFDFDTRTADDVYSEY